jgi:hypothetical protein
LFLAGEGVALPKNGEAGEELRLSGEEEEECGKREAKREDSEERPWPLLRVVGRLSFFEEGFGGEGEEGLEASFFLEGVEGLLGEAVGMTAGERWCLGGARWG